MPATMPPLNIDSEYILEGHMTCHMMCPGWGLSWSCCPDASIFPSPEQEAVSYATRHKRDRLQSEDFEERERDKARSHWW